MKARIIFIKAQAASLLASLIDLSLTVMLAQLFHLWYLAATMTGTVTGGIIHFLMSRGWVFGATDRKVTWQTVKYGMVWIGCLLLNTLGTYVLTSSVGIHYVVSKVSVSVLVGVTYSFLLQKYYVFK